MKYILIGTILGSLVTSEHDSKEACYGRQKILQEKGIYVQCVVKENAYPIIEHYGNLTCNNLNCIAPVGK